MITEIQTVTRKLIVSEDYIFVWKALLNNDQFIELTEIFNYCTTKPLKQQILEQKVLIQKKYIVEIRRV